MKQRIFIAVFVIVCLALVAVSIDSVNCHRANVMLIISQANEISELNGSYTAEGATTFVGLRK